MDVAQSHKQLLTSYIVISWLAQNRLLVDRVKEVSNAGQDFFADFQRESVKFTSNARHFAAQVENII